MKTEFEDDTHGTPANRNAMTMPATRSLKNFRTRSSRFWRIARQATGVVVGRLIAAGAQAVSIVLLARWCEPALFGLTMAFQTALIAIVVASQLGLPQYIAVLRARTPQSSEVSAILRLNRKGSVYVAIATVVPVLALTVFNMNFLFFLPLAFATAWQRNGAVWDSIAVADGNIRLFSTNVVMRRLLALFLFCALYTAHLHPAASYCLAILVSEIAYNLRIKRVSHIFDDIRDKIEILPLLRKSHHFWRDSISGQLRLLDVLIVTLLLGPVAGGFLAVPSKIGSPIMLIPSSFATLLLPRVSAGGYRAAREALFFTLGVAGSIAALLGLVAFYVDNLIPIILGAEYVPASTVTKIYFLVFVCTSVIHMLGATLQGLGLQAAVGRNSIVFSSISLLLIASGAILYGLEAAAWGYAAGTLLQVIGVVGILVLHKSGPLRASK